MHFKKVLITVFVSIFTINNSNSFSSDTPPSKYISFNENTSEEKSYTSTSESDDNAIDNGPDNTDEEDWDIRVLDN